MNRIKEHKKGEYRVVRDKIRHLRVDLDYHDSKMLSEIIDCFCEASFLGREDIYNRIKNG